MAKTKRGRPIGMVLRSGDGRVHLHKRSVKPGLVVWLRHDADGRDPAAFERSNMSLGAFNHPAVVFAVHEESNGKFYVLICQVK